MMKKVTCDSEEHPSLQEVGAAAQLERDEIQRAVITCNDFAEAERRSMHDLYLYLIHYETDLLSVCQAINLLQ